MARSTEDIARLEFHTRGIDFLAPCCEICGCTLDKGTQRWWVEWEGASEGEWPRMHETCLEEQMMKEWRTGIEEDVYPFS